MHRPYSPIPIFLACLVCSAVLSRLILAADPQAYPQASPQSALGLCDLEQIALQRNPTLVQAATQIEASRAKSLQAGLYPNPTIGYQAELIGVKGPTGKRHSR